MGSIWTPGVNFEVPLEHFLSEENSFRDFVSQYLLYLLLSFYEDWYNTEEAIKKVRDQFVWGQNGPQHKIAAFETNF